MKLGGHWFDAIYLVPFYWTLCSRHIRWHPILNRTVFLTSSWDSHLYHSILHFIYDFRISLEPKKTFLYQNSQWRNVFLWFFNPIRMQISHHLRIFFLKLKNTHKQGKLVEKEHIKAISINRHHNFFSSAFWTLAICFFTPFYYVPDFEIYLILFFTFFLIFILVFFLQPHFFLSLHIRSKHVVYSQRVGG